MLNKLIVGSGCHSTKKIKQIEWLCKKKKKNRSVKSTELKSCVYARKKNKTNIFY